MDITSLTGITPVNRVSSDGAIVKASSTGKTSNMFDTILNSAIDNINTTNSLLSDAENAKVSFALGEIDNPHDLMIAIDKASTALNYTVAVRDKFLEAYKEIMQMQI